MFSGLPVVLFSAFLYEDPTTTGMAEMFPNGGEGLTSDLMGGG